MIKLKSIAKEISSKGGKVYYVGGYVRDKILGRENTDIDVEIYGIEVKEVEEILGKYGKVDTVGAVFGVLKVHGLDIDFTFPRTENKKGNKHTDFVVTVNPMMTEKEAGKRRDFTMNTIMENVLTGEIIDNYGGVSDIKKKTLRYVDRETFVEDSLRALRGCQFSARFGFDIDTSVIEVCKGMEYRNLSIERINEEFKKLLLKGKYVSKGLRYMKEMGILKQLLPEIDSLSGIEQNKEFHAEGDVWEHTLLVVDEASKLKNKSSDPLLFMYASLLHDIGKIYVTKQASDGRIMSHNHDIVGSERFEETLRKMETSNKMNKQISYLIKNHMKAHRLLEMKQYKVKKLMVEGNIKDLLLLNLADEKGRISEKYSSDNANKEYKEKLNLVRSLSKGAEYSITPYIQGKDLIRLGYKPSKEIGEMLKYGFDLQLQGREKHEIIKTLLGKYPIQNDKLMKTSNDTTVITVVGFTESAIPLLEKTFQLRKVNECVIKIIMLDKDEKTAVVHITMKGNDFGLREELFWFKQIKLWKNEIREWKTILRVQTGEFYEQLEGIREKLILKEKSIKSPVLILRENGKEMLAMLGNKEKKTRI